jgi:hypothetical protein
VDQFEESSNQTSNQLDMENDFICQEMNMEMSSIGYENLELKKSCKKRLGFSWKKYKHRSKGSIESKLYEHRPIKKRKNRLVEKSSIEKCSIKNCPIEHKSIENHPSESYHLIKDMVMVSLSIILGVCVGLLWGKK